MGRVIEYPNAAPLGGMLREFWCPACKMPHVCDERWGFNGDFDSPTFTPSLNVAWDFGDRHEMKRCHSFVTDGSIQYLGDCTHELAGQTVPLPEHPPTPEKRSPDE